MKERIFATIAGTGMLIAGCGAEQDKSMPLDGELTVGRETYFYTGQETPHYNRDPSLILKVGSKVTGICILFTHAESATLNTGIIRVRAGDEEGVMQTVHIERPGNELHDTFRDKTEADLDREYPHCSELEEKERRESEKASLL